MGWLSLSVYISLPLYLSPYECLNTWDLLLPHIIHSPSVAVCVLVCMSVFTVLTVISKVLFIGSVCCLCYCLFTFLSLFSFYFYLIFLWPSITPFILLQIFTLSISISFHSIMYQSSSLYLFANLSTFFYTFHLSVYLSVSIYVIINLSWHHMFIFSPLVPSPPRIILM